MFIKKLTLNNFKNFSQQEFEFKNINCIAGNNGVGKTTVLDAIHYLSFCRSFLSFSDSDTVKYGEDFFSLCGTYVFDDGSEQCFVISQKKGERKKIKNGKQLYKKFSQHIGKLPCVVVSPNDHNLITGRSEVRRKFVDIILSQTDITYMDCLIKYNKCLEQRNKLLKLFQQTSSPDFVQLEIWDSQLAANAHIIRSKRQEFFDEFAVPFTRYYNFITQSNAEEIPCVQYSIFEGDLTSILKENAAKESILGYTTAGIHRDDLKFMLNSHPVSSTASQGQQKTFLLALKLAQFDFIKTKTKTVPILLLDDIFDKFDFSRVSKILQLVAQDNFKQVFITDTQQDRLEKIIPENKKESSVLIKL